MSKYCEMENVTARERAAHGARVRGLDQARLTLDRRAPEPHGAVSPARSDKLAAGLKRDENSPVVIRLFDRLHDRQGWCWGQRLRA